MMDSDVHMTTPSSNRSPPSEYTGIPSEGAPQKAPDENEKQAGTLQTRLKTAPIHPAIVSAPAATTPSTAATAPWEPFPRHDDETSTSCDGDVASLAVDDEERCNAASPRDTVQGAAHFESVSSDLSSASAATVDDPQTYRYDMKNDLQERAIGGNNTRHRTQLSPTQGYREVPPAPPSTPASHPGHGLSLSFDGLADFVGPPTLAMSIATPIAPMLTGRSYVKNADLLQLRQQEQQLQEGAATPAPTKAAADGKRSMVSSTAATPKPSAAGDSTPKPSGSGSVPLPEDFSDWAVGDRYELVRILGRGSYGEVAQAIDLVKTAAAGGEAAYVAIKRIQSPFDQQLDAVRLYREIHILRRMREGGDETSKSSTNSKASPHHDCVIRLLDVVQPPTDDLDDFHDLYLVFEYVDTDLYKLIMSPQYLTTEHIQTFLYQMLAGLKYIHSLSVIHRDLKPANILLNEDCSLKICDFGLARIVDSDTISSSRHGTNSNKKVVVDDPMEPPKAKRARTGRGFPPVPKTNLTRQLTKHVVTRWYRAPELILIQPYTSAVDVWSLGCIFAELLSMQEGNVPGYEDRKPLFPGGTCYPLSGDGDNLKADERLDQLSMIFRVIGTPPPEDIEASGKAHEYIAAIPKTEGKAFETLYPASDPAAIDLLKKMLQFNATRRVTAEDALEHEFFRSVRRKDLERTADGPLEGPDFLEFDNIDLGLLKQRVYEEVIWYRDHGGQNFPLSAASASESEDN